LIFEVDRAFEEIRIAPTRHALWRVDRPYRWKVLTRFPYLVFFPANDEAVEIVAVAHAKRRPGVLGGTSATVVRAARRAIRVGR
jgi:hypothetical protein